MVGEEEQVMTNIYSSTVDVSLNDYQLNRIRRGCTSTPHNKSLAAVAIAHTVLKGLKKNEEDAFNRSFTSPNNGSKRPRFVSGLVGPTEVVFHLRYASQTHVKT